MLAAFLMALAMQADDWVEPTGPEAAGAVWVSQPSHAQFARVFPTQAEWNATPGRAVLQCVFTAEGRLTDCAVVSETPPGQRYLSCCPETRAVFPGGGEAGRGLAGRQAHHAPHHFRSRPGRSLD